MTLEGNGADDFSKFRSLDTRNLSSGTLLDVIARLALGRFASKYFGPHLTQPKQLDKSTLHRSSWSQQQFWRRKLHSPNVRDDLVIWKRTQPHYNQLSHFPSPPATNCPISANELFQMMQHSCYFVVQSLRLFHAVSSSIRKSCMWAAWNISHAQARDKHQKFTEYFELCLMICK